MPEQNIESAPATQPRLITVKQAADLLAVHPETVRNWIDRELIPFIVLPHEEGGRQEYGVLLQALLNGLSGTSILARNLERITRAVGNSDAGGDPFDELYK